MIDAERIKRRREEVGLTQAEAANKAKLSRQRWNDIEQGRREDLRVSTLGHIATALDCSPCDLLKREPKRRAKK